LNLFLVSTSSKHHIHKRKKKRFTYSALNHDLESETEENEIDETQQVQEDIEDRVAKNDLDGEGSSMWE